MSHPYPWPCLIHMCEVPHSCLWNAAFIRMRCLMLVCHVPHWYFVTRLVHMCDTTHSYDSCNIWLIHVRDMTSIQAQMSSKETYMSSKETYMSSKETYMSSKETCPPPVEPPGSSEPPPPALCVYTCIHTHTILHIDHMAIWSLYIDRKKLPHSGGFPIHYVPSSSTWRKRTPLEAPGTNSSRGVLFLLILDQGTK